MKKQELKLRKDIINDDVNELSIAIRVNAYDIKNNHPLYGVFSYSIQYYQYHYNSFII